MVNIALLKKTVKVLRELSEEEIRDCWDLSSFMAEDASTGKLCSCAVGWSIRKREILDIELIPVENDEVYRIDWVNHGRIKKMEGDISILGILFDMPVEDVVYLFYPQNDCRLNGVDATIKRIEEYITSHEV